MTAQPMVRARAGEARLADSQTKIAERPSPVWEPGPQLGGAAEVCRRRLVGRAVLATAGLGVALLLTTGGVARAEQAAVPGNASPASTIPKVFKVCKGQTYALCAVASCFVFNGLAYCKCDVKSGDSISLSFRFGQDQDVCTANAEGADNGYMVSTFSLPESVVAPGGDKALYTCPAKTSNGAYAHCDGGFCFTSTEGRSFPGFDTPLGDHQIVCSCPIVVADPASANVGYQIAGPFPCEELFFENCKSATANTNTGSTVYVGAPTGVAQTLAYLLNGSVPPLNRCPSPQR